MKPRRDSLWPILSSRLAAAIFLLGFVPAAHAQRDGLQQGDRVLALSYGWAPEQATFVARCPPAKYIAGFDLRTGTGVYAIQPICVTALAPAVAGPFEAYPSLIGGMGPPDPDAPPREEGVAERSRGSRPPERLLRLVCPKDSPVVTQVQVESEQEVTLGWYKPNPSVNGISLYCGLVDRPQGRHVQAAEWLGPLKIRTGSFAGLMDPQRKTAHRENITCPDPLVAVGISGLTRERLFSVGLICGEPRLTEGETVKAQGRIKLPSGTTPDRRPLSTCDSARAARARNSPAAPGLEARCKAEGEQPPIDFDGLAARGEAIASQDPLSVDLRARQPEGPARVGFDIGMAAAEGHTAPGPGKQRIQDALSPLERGGFVFALAFSLDRNRNAELAMKGASVSAADPVTAAARDAQPDVLHRLGFDIATGIFGDPAFGAQGNTATGPGSTGIRNTLGASVQRGFDDGAAFHLNRNYAR